MTYLPTMGATDVVPGFNTTGSPGVCKPMNQATLDLVFELQRQLNRVAQLRSLTKIAVDGDIGPATAKLYNAVLGTNVTCSTISGIIVASTAQIKLLADTLGAPAKVSSPAPAKTPSFVSSTTGLEVPAPKPIATSLSDSFGLSTTTIALLAVGAVGAGYYLTKGKKRGK
jgi:hypothetical protein